MYFRHFSLCYRNRRFPQTLLNQFSKYINIFVTIFEFSSVLHITQFQCVRLTDIKMIFINGMTQHKAHKTMLSKEPAVFYIYIYYGFA